MAYSLAEKNIQHRAIANILSELYKIKNADYDDSFAKSMKEYGMTVACIRLEDKLNRLKALTVKKQEQKVVSESVEDTLYDLANYAIMTIIELSSMKEEKENGKNTEEN